MDMKNEITVSKKVSFDAAHYLPGYDGKCANLHGHHWVVELGVKGPVNPETGMVVDFVALKGFLDNIVEEFDHTLLNGRVENPTAENICLYIRDRALDYYSGLGHILRLEGCGLSFIRVWETEDSMAELRS